MKAIYLMQADLFDRVYTPEDRAVLAESRDEDIPFIAATDFRARLEQLREVETIFSGWGCPLLDASVRHEMPHLRAIFHAAGTVRGVVAPELWTTGVRVSSAAEANAGPVADFAFAAAVFASKFVFQHTESARARRVFVSPSPMGLYGASVGLISLSRIGKRVAERLLASGARVLAYDPSVSEADAASRCVEKVASIGELFARSDIVSCHAPSLPETRGLVRGRHLRRLPAGGHFINTARGAVVDEAELVEVLRERPDLSATIDVTTVEPLPLDSPLRDLRNVFLTPHIAGSQDRECRRLGLFAIEEHGRYQRGEPLLGEILAESLALLA